MIIDSHAYCFESADSIRGYSGVAEHMQWVQRGQARHHQPAFRLNDRTEGPSEALMPAGATPLDKLPDVGFRLDKEAGRVLWDHDGETYTKHFYPPNLRNLEFTPDSLIGEMDYAGIDAVLLHTNPMLGRSIEYQVDCVRRFPGRILSMVPVDEWRIHSEPDVVIDEVSNAVTRGGLHSIKFNPNGYQVSPEPWDAGPYAPFWDAVTKLGVPVFFNLGSGPAMRKEDAPDHSTKDGFVNELRILMRWMERYPDNLVSITQPVVIGDVLNHYVKGDRIVLPDAVWEPFQNPNLSIEVCFPVRIGDLFDYPYREVWPTASEMIERIGPGRLMYGTDMPFQNRFCTYRQSRHWTAPLRPRHRPQRGRPRPHHGRHCGPRPGDNGVTHTLRCILRQNTGPSCAGFPRHLNKPWRRR